MLGAGPTRRVGRAREVALGVERLELPHRLLVDDLLLRGGPHRTSLKALKASKHGLDFGALSPVLPERLQNKTKRIQLAPRLFAADVARLLNRQLILLPLQEQGGAA